MRFHTEPLRIKVGSASAREELLLLVTAALLAYVSLVTYSKIAHEVLGGLGQWHRTHLEGRAPAPLQYRVASFLIPELLMRATGMGAIKAYLTERFAFTFLFTWALLQLSREWFPVRTALLIATLFILFYDLAAFPHIQPSEEPNIFLFACAMGCILRQQFLRLCGVVLAGALTKSTIIFVVPIYFFHQWFTKHRLDSGDLLRAIVLTALIVPVLLVIERHYGTEREYLGGFWQWQDNLSSLARGKVSAYNFILVSVVPATLVFCSWRRQPPLMRAVALTTIPFVLGHFLVSRTEEFRTYMPLALAGFPGVARAVGDWLREPEPVG